jgi:hypothetical protein
MVKEDLHMDSRFDPAKSDGWMILPPGNRAIFRRPVPQQFADGFRKFGCRLATSAELRDANLGAPYPWGYYLDSSKASQLWTEHRIGYGGLYWTEWFATTDGMFGAAPNVPELQPDALRYCLLMPGRPVGTILEDNEGFAFVRPINDVAHQKLWRRVTAHAARHVVADTGRILISLLSSSLDLSKLARVRVGFGGKCQNCHNPEEISINSLRAAVPEYEFVLWEEWHGWQLRTDRVHPLTLTA